MWIDKHCRKKICQNISGNILQNCHVQLQMVLNFGEPLDELVLVTKNQIIRLKPILDTRLKKKGINLKTKQQCSC